MAKMTRDSPCENQEKLSPAAIDMNDPVVDTARGKSSHVTTDVDLENRNTPDMDTTVELENKKNFECSSSIHNSNGPILVTWSSPTDPANPLNWPTSRKWFITILLSCGGLVCLMSSTMLATAVTTIASDLHVSQASANMSLSIFVLAFAFGTPVLAPLAEVFGRRKVWLACSVWYVGWSVGCGFAGSNGFLLAARWFAGLGSSAEYVLTSPILADIWRPEQRGLSFAIATFLPLLGPAIGPLIAGLVTESIGYRLNFWILAIFDALLILSAFFFLPETYGQLLLHRKAQKLAKTTGRAHYTEYDIHSLPLTTRLQKSMIRPFLMMFQHRIIQIMALLLAFNYGTLYLVLTSYASIWTESYHESVSQSGLHYLAMVIRYTLASQGGGKLTDKVWAHLKVKHQGQTAPEYRIPLMLPGIILIPAGLLWFGWAAEKHAPWPVVDAGALIFAIGIILSTQAMQQYLIEAYREHVGSAAAASQFLRNIFAFAFPIFAPALFSSLGYGWGNTTIALVFLVLAVPGPFILWKFGAQLRASAGPVV